MWRRTRRCACASSLAIGLLFLAGCSGDSAPEDEAASPEQTERQKVVSFWQFNREANRLRLAGDFEDAIRNFEAALEIDPAHEDSLFYLGISLEEVGEYDRAEAVYRRILEANPASNRTVTQLADLESTIAPGATPDFEEARKLLERSIAINREHSGPYLRLGRLALMEGDSAEAIRQFETAAGFGSAEGNLMVGFTLLLTGNEAGARERFEAVLAAAERERARTARGEKVEGDVRPTAGNAPASPVQSAAARAEKLMALATQEPPSTVWRDATRAVGLSADGGRAAWADYDGDGWVDALIAGPGPARLYRNNHGRFERVASKALEGAQDVWDAAWGDFDGDGDLDLYLIRPGFIGQGVNGLYRNEGRGAFVDVTSGSGLEGRRSTYAATFADLDGDGRVELVEAGAEGLRVYRRRGDSWSESSSRLGLAATDPVVDFAVADFDGDGRMDVFLLPWRKNVQLYFQGQDGGFADATDEAGLGGVRGRGYEALALDYDLDGDQDLAWADSPDASPSTLRVFLNAGGGSFEETGQAESLAMHGVLGLASGGFDADGLPDLVLASGSLAVGRLEASKIRLNRAGYLDLPPSISSGVSVVDVDQDGRPEVYLEGFPVGLGSEFSQSRLLRGQ